MQTSSVETPVTMMLFPMARRMLPLSTAMAKLPKKMSVVGNSHCDERSVRSLNAVVTAMKNGSSCTAEATMSTPPSPSAAPQARLVRFGRLGPRAPPRLRGGWTGGACSSTFVSVTVVAVMVGPVVVD